MKQAEYVWTGYQNLPQSGLFGSAAYGGGVWVVGWEGGANPKIYRSTDGVTWTLASTIPTLSNGLTQHGTIWDGTRFVSVTNAFSGSTCQVITSTDGNTWSIAGSFGTENGSVRSIAYNGSRYVVMLNSTYDPAYEGAAYSSDLSTWTMSGLRREQWNDVAWGNGVFVACNDVNSGAGSYGWPLASSADGITWTERSDAGLAGSYQSVAFANGLFVVVGDNFLASPDGITWTQQTPPSGMETYSWWAVFHDGARFIALPNESGVAEVAVSKDGFAWTKSITPSLINEWYAYAGSGNRSMLISYGDEGAGETLHALGYLDQPSRQRTRHYVPGPVPWFR